MTGPNIIDTDELVEALDREERGYNERMFGIPWDDEYYAQAKAEGWKGERGAHFAGYVDSAPPVMRIGGHIITEADDPESWAHYIRYVPQSAMPWGMWKEYSRQKVAIIGTPLSADVIRAKELIARLAQMGVEATIIDDGISFTDNSRNGVTITPDMMMLMSETVIGPRQTQEYLIKTRNEIMAMDMATADKEERKIRWRSSNKSTRGPSPNRAGMIKKSKRRNRK